MLRAWERDDPGRTERIFDAMARVVPSHLMDRKLFAFAGIEATGIADADGDRAFDDDDEPPVASSGDAARPAASGIAVAMPARRPPRGEWS